LENCTYWYKGYATAYIRYLKVCFFRAVSLILCTMSYKRGLKLHMLTVRKLNLLSLLCQDEAEKMNNMDENLALYIDIGVIILRSRLLHLTLL